MGRAEGDTWHVAGVCYVVAMRVHITLSEADVKRLDARVGTRRRSSFIAEAVRRALDDEQRWESIESAIGSIPGSGHDWDMDAADWVHRQRHTDSRGRRA
jgi:hypothetical protein